MRIIIVTLLALCFVQSINCQEFKEELEELDEPEEGSGAMVDEILTDDDDSELFTPTESDVDGGSGSGEDPENTIDMEPTKKPVVVPFGVNPGKFDNDETEEPSVETDLQENEPDEVVPVGTASFLSSTHFMAALIVGGCVGLLFAICAIMLLAYRMRKKDEGSYALDEQKKPSSGYQYTQGQEYFA